MTLIDELAQVEQADEVRVSVRAQHRRARNRLRIERALVLLVLPVAVALTVAVLLVPPGTSIGDRGAAPSLRVGIEGALPASLADRLQDTGLAVVRTPVDHAVPETTEVVYYHPDDRHRAGEVRDRLGMGTLVLGRLRPGSVDLTITVGKDLSRE